MRVEVIKIGEYDPTQGGKYSKYDGYCLSTREEVDLGVVADADKEFKNRPPATGSILHSTLLRAVQTVHCLPKLSKASLVPLHQLREIPFRLDSLVSRDEFEEGGSGLVRERLLKRL